MKLIVTFLVVISDKSATSCLLKPLNFGANWKQLERVSFHDSELECLGGGCNTQRLME